jgi:hypothetical protein
MYPIIPGFFWRRFLVHLFCQVPVLLDNVSLSKGEVFGSEVGKKEPKAG